MHDRAYTANSSNYRYGFNGKENDNEVKGTGNQQDYGMRIYDPRIGKFLSVDPLTAKYPELTPYQFASNRPIDGIDLDGKEFLSIKAYKMNSPFTIMEKDAIQRKRAFDNTKIGKSINGVTNITLGGVGTVASAVYIGGTDGAGAAFGGAFSLTMFLGQMSVGGAQLADVYHNKYQDVDLQRASNIPGLLAYKSNNSGAPFIDGASGALAGTFSGGNILTLVRAPTTISQSKSLLSLSYNLLNAYSAKVSLFSVGSGYMAWAENKAPGSYTVQQGDTLGGISKKFGVSISDIVNRNKIADPNKIKTNQILQIQ